MSEGQKDHKNERPATDKEKDVTCDRQTTVNADDHKELQTYRRKNSMENWATDTEKHSQKRKYVLNDHVHHCNSPQSTN